MADSRRRAHRAAAWWRWLTSSGRPGGPSGSGADMDAAEGIRAQAAGLARDRLLLDDAAQRLHAQVSDNLPFGRATLGRPMGPTALAFRRGLGYLMVVAVAAAVISVASQLLLIVVATFLAIGLEPVVMWMQRRGLRRGWAVALLVLIAVGMLVAFLAAAIPPLVHEGGQLVSNAPAYLKQLQDQHDSLGEFATSLHLPERLQTLSNSSLSVSSFNGIVDLGRTALSYGFQLLVVVVLTIYILADLPGIKRSLYRLVPRESRPRVGLLGDEMIARTGGYLLGNVLTSVVAAASQYVELRLLAVPFALLLAVLVGVFDLIPLVGSTIAGLVAVTVALALVSPTAAVVTVGYLVVYRVFEDYWLSPRILRRTVEVQPLVTIVSVLLGGALLGLEGALIAVPVAAAVQLVVTEVVYPRTDGTS